MTNLSSTYEATDAQEDYHHKRMNSRPKGKFTKIRAHYLTQALAATLSLEQTEGRLKLEHHSMRYLSKQSTAGFMKES